MAPRPDEPNPDRTDLAEASTLRWLFARAVFPVTFFGALLAARAGLDAGLPHLGAVALAVLPAAFVVIVSERLQPYARSWSRSHGDVRTDLTHMLLSQVAPPQLVDAVFAVTLATLGAWLAARVPWGLWPDWGFWPELFFAMVLGEFGQYWWHRKTHESDLLWRIHATHHSAPRLWWLNAGRFHPLDTVLAYSTAVGPLVVLGAPADIVAGSVVFTAVHGMFQHANIDLRLGPLNWVFSMAELHRWHHSEDLGDANANYGANLICWDIVFGTRHLPDDRRHDPRDIGFHGDAGFPRTYGGQVASVFRWAEVAAAVEEARGRSESGESDPAAARS